MADANTASGILVNFGVVIVVVVEVGIVAAIAATIKGVA